MEYRVVSEEVEVVYWPKMGKDIEDFISSCAVHKSYQPNQQKEPMVSHEIPTRPWEKVGCDLFDFEDNHYLVCVDYYSDYFELDRICDKKGKEVISKLKSQFARHGIPPSRSLVTMVHPSVLRSFRNLRQPMSLNT